MNNLAEFPRGYRIGRAALHDWSQQLKVTRERDAEGAEYCICWVGTFSLVTTDGGGWRPDDGVALGVKPDGTTVLDDDWRGEFCDVAVRVTPRWPLSHWLEIARYLAEAATGWIPAVDLSFAAGDTLDQVEAAATNFFVTNPVDHEGANLLTIAFLLLWLCEEERREAGE